MTPTPPAGLLADVPYTTDADPRRLDLYRPEPAPAGPAPVVLWIHGGGWCAGDKADPPMRYLTAAGYAVASIDYRLTPDWTFPAAVHDAKAAVRWLRAHAREHRLDPGRIAATGASAGGHLAALLGTTGDLPELEGRLGWAGHSSAVQAVFDSCGPTDLTQSREAIGDLADGFARFLGAPAGERPDLARLASPLHQVRPGCPPFLILHGDADDVIPLAESVRLADALADADGDVTLEVVPGGGHGVGNESVCRMIRAFLDRVLAPATPAAPDARG